VDSEAVRRRRVIGRQIRDYYRHWEKFLGDLSVRTGSWSFPSRPSRSIATSAQPIYAAMHGTGRCAMVSNPRNQNVKRSTPQLKRRVCCHNLQFHFRGHIHIFRRVDRASVVVSRSSGNCRWRHWSVCGQEQKRALNYKTRLKRLRVLESVLCRYRRCIC